AGAYDPVLDRTIVVGAFGESHPSFYYTTFMDNQVYTLTFPATVGVSPSPVPSAGLMLEGARPNPSAGAWTLAFTLPTVGDATLPVFDVRGRAVLSHHWRGLAGGPQSRDLPEASRLAPGIYYLRLAQGGRVANARAVRL